MKKLLLLILIALLLALSIFIVMNGLEVSGIEMLGITGIQDRDSELETVINEATKLAQKDYQVEKENVEANIKKLETEKKKYEEMTLVSTEGEIQIANQIEKYEIESLWVKLGNHAINEGTIIKMDIVNGSSPENGIYNLKFTVTGSYISIIDYISAIETDSTLGFRIEEFKMVQATEEGKLSATFICKDITIKGVNQATPQKEPETNTQNEENTNSTTNTNNT